MKKKLLLLIAAIFLMMPVFADQSYDEIEKMVYTFIKEGSVVKVKGLNPDTKENSTVFYSKLAIEKYTIDFSNFYDTYYLLIGSDNTYFNFNEYDFSLDKEKNLIITKK
ncbi:MAG: hypothetical protein MJ159_04345 [Treponemataceae bacterium]|nr:hypothetical protein [Treponemataceae bacterium]